MHLLHVVGARPNFMKAAPVLAALNDCAGVRQTLVHTGQHYDANMSDVFFQELNLPQPDVNLGVGSGSHTVQTAQVMLRFEEVLLESRPDWVMVYGDVNSTVAAALVAAKLHIPVAHVEAGLRSFDRTMPEEINRLVTDQLADRLFTPSEDGNLNLTHEGVSAGKISLVGNAMIDTLIRLLPAAARQWLALREHFELEPQRYILVTLHRPSNVDEAESLTNIMSALNDLGHTRPILFPVHPHTRQRLHDLAIPVDGDRVRPVDPLGYIDFLALQQQAALVITDSGGIQEETTYLQVPCLTVRENTERPITVTLGTNQLVGQDMVQLRHAALRILGGDARGGQIPPLWDGQTGERIARIMMDI